jgi:Carboxypeptidase regulatory-like domain/TonB dependent receptor
LRHRLAWVFAAVTVALCPHPSLGQQSVDTATVTGTITDQSGGVIAGASVDIRSTDRNQTRDTRTSDRGRFAFLYLPPGPYEISIDAHGFARSTVPLTLTIGQALDVPIALALSGLSTQVEVTAQAPALETRRTQANATILPAEIDALPLNGRNYLDLALLAPGVSRTVQRNTERFAETSAVPGTGVSFGGQRNLNNTFIVDGLSANDDAAGLAGTYFAEDVIREFQVVTSGGIAEFGRASSGIVSIVTKSGGNTRHGRGYGFFRDDALDARNPLASRKDPLEQAQYGFSLSGPLARDRAFWFANAERTDLARTGIITIAASAVDPINLVLDRAAYGGPRLATGEFPTGYDTSNVFGRVDHAASDASHLGIRYSLYDVASENARNVGGLNAVSRGTRLDNRDQTLAGHVLSSLSATAVNEFRAQATRSRLSAPPNDLTGPAVNISGIASFGTATFSPTERDLDVYELSNSLTLHRGNHLIKGGAGLLYERLDIVFPGAVQGVYAFSSLANFQAGRYINYQQAFGEAAQFQTNTNLGLFVQDEWRPHASLTVNAGLRYDVQSIEDPVRTDLGNVAPRVGLAFAPGDGRTVLRASGGLYYDRIPLRAVSNALQRDGIKYQVALVPFGQAGAPVFPDRIAGLPAGVLTNITSIDPGIENGVGRQFNVEIERQLSRGLSGRIGYTHLTGRNIIMSRNINVPTLSAAEAAAQGVSNLGRPDSRVGNNGQFQSIGQSSYNALIISGRATGGRLGWHRVSYTHSKALDDAGNAFFSSPQGNFNPHDDYGRSDNDQRHRVVVSGAAPIAWNLDVAYLFSYASAPPFNVQTGTDRNNDTNVNDRPIGIGRNTGRGFDFSSLDVRVSRTFRLGGRHTLEAIVDAFNVLNRTNFLIPNITFGPGVTPLASFGQPTAAGDARQLQLGVRWTF